MQVRGIPLQLRRVDPVVDAAFPQLARERPELPHLRQRRLHQRERDPEAVRRLQRHGVGGGGDLRLANQDMQFAGTRSKRLLVAMKRLDVRSEEHTSELQSLMRTSYAGFCLEKKIQD